MSIEFHPDNTLGDGDFIRVVRGGRPFGRIFLAAGVHRFYKGNQAKLGGAALQDEDLEQLKAAILARYGTDDADEGGQA